ncbi:MAG: DUF4279 domain-containing protein [Porticoccaceae bacterium]|nr:DUF4279 domain-containing protein [Porticoccaceae bacterium]
MSLSDFHKSTIIEVRAYFGFTYFECDPEEITATLGVRPDIVMRKGEVRTLKSGKKITNAFSSWSIQSCNNSKDVNDHLRELLQRMSGCGEKISKRFGSPGFSVLWKGNYLYAGSGPFYEADVLQGVAELKGMLWHDIYQVDEENE